MKSFSFVNYFIIIFAMTLHLRKFIEHRASRVYPCEKRKRENIAKAKNRFSTIVTSSKHPPCYYTLAVPFSLYLLAFFLSSPFLFPYCWISFSRVFSLYFSSRFFLSFFGVLSVRSNMIKRLGIKSSLGRK